MSSKPLALLCIGLATICVHKPEAAFIGRTPTGRSAYDSTPTKTKPTRISSKYNTRDIFTFSAKVEDRQEDTSAVAISYNNQDPNTNQLFIGPSIKSNNQKRARWIAIFRLFPSRERETDRQKSIVHRKNNLRNRARQIHNSRSANQRQKRRQEQIDVLVAQRQELQQTSVIQPSEELDQGNQRRKRKKQKSADASFQGGRWRRFRVQRPRFGRGERLDKPEELETSGSTKKKSRRSQKMIKARNEDFNHGPESLSPISTSLTEPEKNSDELADENWAGESMDSKVLEKANVNDEKAEGDYQINDTGDESGNQKSKKGGKRVTFSATREASRILTLGERTLALFNEYMTQSVEKYSLISFHDESDGKEESPSSRRWVVRRLTKEESIDYVERISHRTDDDDYNEEGRYVDADKCSGADNFFRLAVPLMPLVGLDLTPVMDLEVIPASGKPVTTDTEEGSPEVNEGETEPTSQPRSAFGKLRERLGRKRKTNEVSNGNITPIVDLENIPASGEPVTDDTEKGSPEVNEGETELTSQPKFGFGKLRRRLGRRKTNEVDNGNIIKIRSLRVSLLSTEDEVSQAMKQKPARRRRGSNKKQEKSTPAVRNKSVLTMGYEAIGTARKVEEWVHPKLFFGATITWSNDGEISDERNATSLLSEKGSAESSTHNVALVVKSSAKTSVTVPSLLPLPPLLVRKAGSAVTGRALDLALPRFLNQLERDFERWASIGDNESDLTCNYDNGTEDENI